MSSKESPTIPHIQIQPSIGGVGTVLTNSPSAVILKSNLKKAEDIQTSQQQSFISQHSPSNLPNLSSLKEEIFNKKEPAEGSSGSFGSFLANSLNASASSSIFSVPQFQWDSYEPQLKNEAPSPTIHYAPSPLSSPISPRNLLSTNSSLEKSPSAATSSSSSIASSNTLSPSSSSSNSPSTTLRKGSASAAAKKVQRRTLLLANPISLQQQQQQDLLFVYNIDWKTVGQNVFVYPNDDIEILQSLSLSEEKTTSNGIPIDSSTLLHSSNRGYTHDPILKEVLEDTENKYESYIKNCVQIFTEENRIVKHRYVGFGNKFKPQAEPEIQVAFPRGRMNSQPLDLVLDQKMIETHTNNDESQLNAYIEELSEEMKKGRSEIFASFPSTEKENIQGPITPPIFPLTEKMPEAMLMLSDIQLDQVKEPLFYSFSLHNSRSREKISEEFETLSDEIYKQMDMEESRRRPLFYVNTGSVSEMKDVILVVRISKLLREGSGEQEIQSDPTSKKEAEFFKSALDELKSPQGKNSRGNILVPCLWGAVSLFDETGKLGGSVQNPVLASSPSSASSIGNHDTFRLRKFPMELKIIKSGATITNEYIYDSLQNDSIAKKTKLFPNKLILGIKNPKTESKGKKYNSSNMVSKEDLLSTEENAIIQEVQYFDEKTDPFPHTNYFNDLYIYPESLSIKVPSESNVMIKVELRMDCNSLEGSGKKHVYSPYSKTFAYHHFTLAPSSSKQFLYTDEIKIKLPPILNNKSHVFFTFYNCSARKGGKSSTVLGHAFIPIFEGQKIINDERHYLHLSKGDFPNASYLQEGQVKWSKEKKLIVRTKLHSSVFSSDPYLNRFFLEYHKCATSADQSKTPTTLASSPSPISPVASLKANAVSKNNSSPSFATRTISSANLVTNVRTISVDCIRSLDLINYRDSIRFLPILFNCLFYVLIKPEKSQAKEAFLAIIGLLKKLSSQAAQSILASYVYYIFDNPMIDGENGKERKPVYEALCKYWLEVITKENEKISQLKSYWFLFQIMSKSIYLDLKDRRLLNQSDRSSRFTTKFTNRIEKLMKKLVAIGQGSYDGIVSPPLFVNDLFSILDRGLVFKIIFDFAQNSSSVDSSSAFVKFNWMKVIADFEHYIPLNLVENIDINPLQIAEIPQKFWKKHFLTGLLLHEVNISLKENMNREQWITLFKNLLRKHEFDPRYQGQNMTLVCDIYFPFILMVTSESDTIHTLNEGLIHKWILSFLFILKHCSIELLKSWLAKESQNRKDSFLKFLLLGLNHFMDKNECCEVNVLSLQILMIFVESFDKTLNREDNPLNDTIFTILKKLLSSQNDLFISKVYNYLNVIITKLSKAIFISKTVRYFEDLLYVILNHCNSTNLTIQSKASTILYLLMRLNWLEVRSIARIRHFAQVSSSRFIGEKKKNEGLKHALQKIMEYCEDQLKNVNATMRDIEGFTFQANELIQRLMDISKYDNKIALNWVDEESTADIYRQIADDYIDSPDLRLTWLDNLALIQVQWGNIEEAAQSKIALAYLICQHLNRNSPNLLPPELRRDVETSPFTTISPNVFHDLQLSEAVFVDESRFQSSNWSLNGLVSFLRDASTLLARERRYEMCLEIFHILMLIHKHDKNYAEMIKWAEQYKELAENLVKVTVEGREVFSRYYRITFFGKAWANHIDNRSFIYKKKYKFTIGDIAQSIIKQLAHKTKLDTSNIVSLPNKEVDPETLDSQKIYFQIVAVKPYFSAEDLASRSSLFAQNFNISKFLSEIPFMKGGGKFNEDDVGKQQKRKTIYHLERAFPYLNNRIPIKHTEEIILEPIECAIESMQERANQFRAEVYATPPRKNVLQALLTGTLATTVHAGPMKFCEVFLGEEQQEYPEKLKDQLREVMGEVLLLAKVGLEINEGIIGPEQIPFHDMLQDKFGSTMDVFQTKYKGASVWQKVSQSIEVQEKQARQQAKVKQDKLSKK
eukprot:TRINITY_DN611_c0_g1_i2.p1 TRINITY_DN611_c0_g1~~TRINITY_DN611_c0_g1_i2.p1  ORF type:complete len:1956 (-),score=658.81 TRINITY_DN611_c0_g1_i2:97-5964(-)